MTAADPATRDAIAEVLAAHWEAGGSNREGYKCQCGHPLSGYDWAVPEHVPHIADALAPLIARLCAEKVDQALAEVEGGMRRGIADPTIDHPDLFERGIDAGLLSAARIVAARRTGGGE